MSIGYEGDILSFSDGMKSVGWNAPKGIDPDKVDAIKKALESEKNFKPNWTIDSYWHGLELGRASRLALIADELGEKDTAKLVRENLKFSLLKWLKG